MQRPCAPLFFEHASFTRSGSDEAILRLECFACARDDEIRRLSCILISS
jgi:hypothetical protein